VVVEDKSEESTTGYAVKIYDLDNCLLTVTYPVNLMANIILTDKCPEDFRKSAYGSAWSFLNHLKKVKLEKGYENVEPVDGDNGWWY
jgi:hypothetical protein